MSDPNHIRNFVIIAHIDHGKSTLADRMLELTHTVEARKMKPQLLDSMDLERERGITIKMQPVRMIYHPNRGSPQMAMPINADEDTRINADQNADEHRLLYEDTTYAVRGALFAVYNTLGPGFKEIIYQNALAEEFRKRNLVFERERIIDVEYEDKKVGVYKPDFAVAEEVLIELKALPFLGKLEKKQAWQYLRGSPYKLLLLVNFGATNLQIERIVYDKARDHRAFIRENLRNDLRLSAYVLNLIDTPGHVDFSYEVSRALAAVEGAVLLVDATQGVQAQTITNLSIAEAQGLAIIPVINKIDLPEARVEETAVEIMQLLPIRRDEILSISGKTGEGVETLLEAIVERIPPPLGPGQRESALRALIFDSTFESHKGVIAFVRVCSSAVRRGDNLTLLATGAPFDVKEVGTFAPAFESKGSLAAGEIGYIVTAIKNPGDVKIGDTLIHTAEAARMKVGPLPGYKEPMAMVWASLYPASEEEFDSLQDALAKLKLNDAALSFEVESSRVLGRSFLCGFLGMLHLEIIVERLKREYNVEVITTMPSVAYQIALKDGSQEVVSSAAKFPSQDVLVRVREPWLKVEIIVPAAYFGSVLTLIDAHEGHVVSTESFGQASNTAGPGPALRHAGLHSAESSGEVEGSGAGRITLFAEIPLREIITDFFDKLKSVSSGYASMAYEPIGFRDADVERLDILVAEEPVPALTRIVSRRKLETIARSTVASLQTLIPRQLFVIKIQAAAQGRIIASESVSPLKKDVTGHLYGGDRTRKMKLWKKQKRGKERMREHGKARISPDVFLKMLKR